MDEDRSLNLFGNALLFLACLYWFWQVVLLPHDLSNPPWVFLDNANLVFHEAGHFIFLFFGDFLHVLGGSLNQLLIPAIVLVAFIHEEQPFSAGFALFWLGESAVNVSYYIADARSQLLPLLGGDPSGHDWTWLLTRMNLMQDDTLIGNVVRFMAVLAMIAGIIWMAWAMYKNRPQSSLLG